MPASTGEIVIWMLTGMEFFVRNILSKEMAYVGPLEPLNVLWVVAIPSLMALAGSHSDMPLNPMAQARIWQVLFALVALVGLFLFSVPGGTPLGFALTGIGAVCWVAVTAIISYHTE